MQFFLVKYLIDRIQFAVFLENIFLFIFRSKFYHVLTWLYPRLGGTSFDVTKIRRNPLDEWSNHPGTTLVDWLDALHRCDVRDIHIWIFHQFHGLQTSDGILGHTGCVLLADNYIWRFREFHHFRPIFGWLDRRRHFFDHRAICGRYC